MATYVIRSFGSVLILNTTPLPSFASIATVQARGHDGVIVAYARDGQTIGRGRDGVVTGKGR